MNWSHALVVVLCALPLPVWAEDTRPDRSLEPPARNAPRTALPVNWPPLSAATPPEPTPAPAIPPEPSAQHWSMGLEFGGLGLGGATTAEDFGVRTLVPLPEPLAVRGRAQLWTATTSFTAATAFTVFVTEQVELACRSQLLLNAARLYFALGPYAVEQLVANAPFLPASGVGFGAGCELGGELFWTRHLSVFLEVGANTGAPSNFEHAGLGGSLFAGVHYYP